MKKKSEIGFELTEMSYEQALLWLDIETLARDGTYQPEGHYQALLFGKPLHEYRNATDEEIIAMRDLLATKVLKEQLKTDNEGF